MPNRNALLNQNFVIIFTESLHVNFDHSLTASPHVHLVLMEQLGQEWPIACKPYANFFKRECRCVIPSATSCAHAISQCDLSDNSVKMQTEYLVKQQKIWHLLFLLRH